MAGGRQEGSESLPGGHRRMEQVPGRAAQQGGKCHLQAATPHSGCFMTWGGAQESGIYTTPEPRKAFPVQAPERL